MQKEHERNPLGEVDQNRFLRLNKRCVFGCFCIFVVSKVPNGEKRPADAVGLAVLIGRIATGEVEDVVPDDGKDKAAQALGKKGGILRWKH